MVERSKSNGRTPKPLGNLGARVDDIVGEQWEPIDPDNIYQVATKIALIGCEAAEAMEAHRVDDKANLAEELGDVIIRTTHLAWCLGIDLDQAVENKVAATPKPSAKRY